MDKKKGFMKQVQGNPETAQQQATNYGTYNIQPTADTENEYPAIAQGLSKRERDQNSIPTKKRTI